MKALKKIFKKTDQDRVEDYLLLLKMKFLVLCKTINLKFKIIMVTKIVLLIIMSNNKNKIMIKNKMDSMWEIPEVAVCLKKLKKISCKKKILQQI